MSFSRNSEAFAPEFLENIKESFVDIASRGFEHDTMSYREIIKEMFPGYWLVNHAQLTPCSLSQLDVCKRLTLITFLSQKIISLFNLL